MKNWSDRTKLLLAVAVLLVCGAFVAPGTGGGPDPCNYAQKRQAPMPAATATTALLVTHFQNTEIHVCHINGTVGNTSSLQFLQGTATTALAAITGAETAVLTGTSGMATLFRVPVGQDLWYKTTGTGAPGWVTYVYEQPGNALMNPTDTPFATPSQTPTPTPTASPTATPT